jgi:hypothetical protein
MCESPTHAHVKSKCTSYDGRHNWDWSRFTPKIEYISYDKLRIGIKAECLYCGATGTWYYNAGEIIEGE